jgi:hypothetical protein
MLIKKTADNTGFMLLLHLGFSWTLGLLSFFFFIAFFFQKFSVYLLWSVIKTATDIKPGNVGGQLSGEKTLTINSHIKIKNLTNYFTPSCAKKLKIEKLKIEKFYAEILSEFSSRFSKMFIFVFVNFWFEKHNAENCLSKIEPWKSKT